MKNNNQKRNELYDKIIAKKDKINILLSQLKSEKDELSKMRIELKEDILKQDKVYNIKGKKCSAVPGGRYNQYVPEDQVTLLYHDQYATTQIWPEDLI